MLKNGDKAPAFNLRDTTGTAVNSAQFGKPIVLIFTRGKFCPTTNRFLTAWQDFYGRIKDLDMELLAISADSSEIAVELKAQLGLTFPLLADMDVAVAKQYGVYTVARGNGEFAEPALIIIDKDGDVAYSIISSGPKGLPEPGAIAPILIYMHMHGGKY